MRDVAPGQLSEDVAELQRLVRVSERARHIAELRREVLESALSHHETARALQRWSAAARTAHSRAQDAAGSWAEERDRFQVVRQSRITSGSLPRRSRGGRVKSDSEVGLLRKICETRASVERMLALTSDRRRRMANQLSSERLELRECEEKVANLRSPTAGCLGGEEACARESLLTELKSEMIMSEAARSAALGRADLLSIPLARLQCVREDKCSVEASLA